MSTKRNVRLRREYLYRKQVREYLYRKQVRECLYRKQVPRRESPRAYRKPQVGGLPRLPPALRAAA